MRTDQFSLKPEALPRGVADEGKEMRSGMPEIRIAVSKRHQTQKVLCSPRESPD